MTATKPKRKTRKSSEDAEVAAYVNERRLMMKAAMWLCKQGESAVDVAKALSMPRHYFRCLSWWQFRWSRNLPTAFDPESPNNGRKRKTVPSTTRRIMRQINEA